MLAEIYRAQDASFDIDNSLFEEVDDYLAASRFAREFYGRTSEENLLWIKAFDVPTSKQVFRVKNGFNVEVQIAGYLRVYSDLIHDGASVEEINATFAKLALQDYEGYNFEYVAQEPILKNHLKRENGRVVAYKYENTPLEEVPSESERGGIYKETIQLLVKELVDAEPGTVFAITSPKGWAGTDSDGNTLVYPESQTYLYRINEADELEAITIRTDMTADEHEEFLRLMTDGAFQAEDKEDDIQRLMHISGSLVKRTDMNFADVIGVMKRAANNKVAWTNGGKKRVTFDEMLNKITNIENLYIVDNEVERVLEDFKSQMLNFGSIKSKEDLQRLMALLGKTALDISHAYRTKDEDVKPPTYSHGPTHTSPPTIDYHAEALRLATLPGCMAVGTTNSNWQKTALGPRLVESTSDYFECPKCKGKIESGKGITKCPHCGITKEEAGSNCD